MDGDKTPGTSGKSERETYRGTVQQWEVDFFGHMNVRFYVGKFDEASWQFLAGFGMDRRYFDENRRAFFAVRQEIDYLSELLPADPLTVTSALLDMSEKKLVWRHTMRNSASGEVAAVMHLTAVHVDREARKGVPLPDEVLAACRAALVKETA